MAVIAVGGIVGRSQAGIAGYAAHSFGVDGVVPRYVNFAGSVAHCDVLALPDNSETRLFQRADCSLVVDAWYSWQRSDCRFDCLGLNLFYALEIYFNLVKAYFEIPVFRRIFR